MRTSVGEGHIACVSTPRGQNAPGRMCVAARARASPRAACAPHPPLTMPFAAPTSARGACTRPPSTTRRRGPRVRVRARARGSGERRRRRRRPGGFRWRAGKPWRLCGAGGPARAPLPPVRTPSVPLRRPGAVVSCARECLESARAQACARACGRSRLRHSANGRALGGRGDRASTAPPPGRAAAAGARAVRGTQHGEGCAAHLLALRARDAGSGGGAPRRGASCDELRDMC